MEDRLSIPHPKCWICKDSGMVIYRKIHKGLSYEMASRCSCLLGNGSSERIPLVPKKWAEDIARKNFENFLEVYPDFLKNLSQG